MGKRQYRAKFGRARFGRFKFGVTSFTKLDHAVFGEARFGNFRFGVKIRLFEQLKKKLKSQSWRNEKMAYNDIVEGDDATPLWGNMVEDALGGKAIFGTSVYPAQPATYTVFKQGSYQI